MTSHHAHTPVLRMIRVITLVLVTIMASSATAKDAGVRFPGGAEIAARLSPEKPVRALAVIGPAYAIWGAEGFAAPVRFTLYANHLAFIDRWRLSVHRLGDAALERPVKVFSGIGASLFDEIEWDGIPDDGPPVRPGERLVYTLEVADSVRNIDATDPRSFLVARYLSDDQRSSLSRQVAAMRAGAARGAPLRRAEIPVGGVPLRLTAERLRPGMALDIDGARLTADGTGRAAMEQILPPGPYALPVSLGPARRILPLSVRGAAFVRAPLLAEPPLAPGSAAEITGLTFSGMAEGADVLSLAAPASRAEARAALARIAPGRAYAVYGDVAGGAHVRVPLEAGAALWGGPLRTPGAEPAPETMTIAAHGLRLPSEDGAIPFTPAAAPLEPAEETGFAAGIMSALSGLLSRRLVLDW